MRSEIAVGSTRFHPTDSRFSERPMDAAEFLYDLADDLARIGVTSRDLVALVIEANGLDIDVRTRHRAHPDSYPALDRLLSTIAARCAEDSITLRQLRRVTFTDRQVDIEYLGQDDRFETCSLPIDRSLKLLVPVQPTAILASSGTIREREMASRSTDGSAGRSEGRPSGATSGT